MESDSTVGELWSEILRDSTDGPREVLADWLIAKGDPRGELIHLQLMKSRGVVKQEHLDRERELLSEHGLRWTGAPPNWQVSWSRGFVDSVIVDGVDLSASGELRSELRTANDEARIEAVTLTRFFESQEARMIRSARVTLTDFETSVPALIATLAKGRQPFLEELALELRYGRLGPSALSISTLGGTLAFPRPGSPSWPLIKPDMMADLAVATPNLKELRVSGPGLLSRISHPSLQTIRVFGHETVLDNGLLIIESENLETLELIVDTPADESEGFEVSGLRLATPRLKHLSFAGGLYSGSPDSLVRFVAESAFGSRLETLELPSISRMDNLTELFTKMRHLQTLYISDIDDIDVNDIDILSRLIPQLKLATIEPVWIPAGL